MHFHGLQDVRNALLSLYSKRPLKRNADILPHWAVLVRTAVGDAQRSGAIFILQYSLHCYLLAKTVLLHDYVFEAGQPFWRRGVMTVSMHPWVRGNHSTKLKQCDAWGGSLREQW